MLCCVLGWSPPSKAQRWRCCSPPLYIGRCQAGSLLIGHGGRGRGAGPSYLGRERHSPAHCGAASPGPRPRAPSRPEPGIPGTPWEHGAPGHGSLPAARGAAPGNGRGERGHRDRHVPPRLPGGGAAAGRGRSRLRLRPRPGHPAGSPGSPSSTQAGEPRPWRGQRRKRRDRAALGKLCRAGAIGARCSASGAAWRRGPGPAAALGRGADGAGWAAPGGTRGAERARTARSLSGSVSVPAPRPATSARCCPGSPHRRPGLRASPGGPPCPAPAPGRSPSAAASRARSAAAAPRAAPLFLWRRCRPAPGAAAPPCPGAERPRAGLTCPRHSAIAGRLLPPAGRARRHSAGSSASWPGQATPRPRFPQSSLQKEEA